MGRALVIHVALIVIVEILDQAAHFFERIEVVIKSKHLPIVSIVPEIWSGDS